MKIAGECAFGLHIQARDLQQDALAGHWFHPNAGSDAEGRKGAPRGVEVVGARRERDGRGPVDQHPIARGGAAVSEPQHRGTLLEEAVHRAGGGGLCGVVGRQNEHERVVAITINRDVDRHFAHRIEHQGLQNEVLARHFEGHLFGGLAKRFDHRGVAAIRRDSGGPCAIGRGEHMRDRHVVLVNKLQARPHRLPELPARGLDGSGNGDEGFAPKLLAQLIGDVGGGRDGCAIPHEEEAFVNLPVLARKHAGLRAHGRHVVALESPQRFRAAGHDAVGGGRRGVHSRRHEGHFVESIPDGRQSKVRMIEPRTGPRRERDHLPASPVERIGEVHRQRIGGTVGDLRSNPNSGLTRANFIASRHRHLRVTIQSAAELDRLHIALVEDFDRGVVERLFRKQADGAENRPQRIVVLSPSAQIDEGAPGRGDVVWMIESIDHRNDLVVSEHDIAR